MYRFGAILIIVAIVSACAVGPDYKRPTIESPQTWRFGEKEAQETVDTLWWKQFGDPVLDNLIEDALKENKDIKIAAARIEEFLGHLRTTRAALFPQVSGGAPVARRDVTRYSNPPWPPTADNPYWDYQTFLSASWQVDLWGQLRRATEAARADLMSTEEGRRGVILTVVSTVATTYTELRDLDKQLEIAQATVKSREDSVKLFRLRYDRGLVSRSR